MLGPGAVLGEDGDDVAEHLRELAGERVARRSAPARPSRPRRR